MSNKKVKLTYTVKTKDGFLSDRKEKFLSVHDAMKFVKKSKSLDKNEIFFGKPVIS